MLMDKMETHNFERYMIDLDHILDKVPKSINDLHSFLKFLHPNVTLNFTVDSKKKGENYLPVKPLNPQHIIKQLSLAINVMGHQKHTPLYPAVTYITDHYLQKQHEE